MTLRNSNECITDERRAEWVELHYTYRGTIWAAWQRATGPGRRKATGRWEPACYIV